MSIIRICHESDCRTQLSTYNPTTYCWEHRRSTRRIEDELAGRHILRDDDWLLRSHPGAEVETWRPHVMSGTFIDGLERGVLSPAEREAYETGKWLGG